MQPLQTTHPHSGIFKIFYLNQNKKISYVLAGRERFLVKRKSLIMLLILFNIASVVITFSVVVTCWSFGLLQKQQYMVVAYYTAISVFLMAVGSAFGSPPDETMACWMQALFTKIFIMSALMWGTVIVYMMYYVTVYASRFIPDWKHHLLCWGLPVFLAFLPLINVTYGRSEEYDICWLKPTRHTPQGAVKMWQFWSFYVPIDICFLIMMICFAHCFLIFFFTPHGPVKICLGAMMRKLIIFPMAFLVCNFLLVFFGMLGHALKGTVCGIGFWALNKDLRLLWSAYFGFLFDMLKAVCMPVRPAKVADAAVVKQKTKAVEFYRKHSNGKQPAELNGILIIPDVHETDAVLDAFMKYAEDHRGNKGTSHRHGNPLTSGNPFLQSNWCVSDGDVAPRSAVAHATAAAAPPPFFAQMKPNYSSAPSVAQSCKVVPFDQKFELVAVSVDEMELGADELVEVEDADH